jgi:transposase|tara:strand:- start:464 stop:1042 length:579 start_codon:yes stop_codon:yes gene_type:complete
MVWLKKGDQFLVEISKSELKKMYLQEKNAKAKLRLLAALQRKEGNTLESIAFSLSKPKMTISDWLRRLENKGIDGMYDIKQSGKPHRLTKEQLKKLDNILSDSPEKQGLPFVIWTTKLVQYIIVITFEVRYVLRNVWFIVKKLGYNLKVPRQENRKRNLKAQEEFKKNLKQKYNIILNLDSRSFVLTKHTSS